MSHQTAVASPLALENARELAGLKQGQLGFHADIAYIKEWMRSLEGSFKAMSDEVRASLSRVNQRNPMVYIGVASLVFIVIGMASTLTIFTINTQIRPLQETMKSWSDSVTELRAQERMTFESVTRLKKETEMLDAGWMRPPITK